MRYFPITQLLAGLSVAALAAACTVEPVTDIIPADGPVTITVSIPDGGLTKVALTQDADPDGAVKLTWQDTDVITVKDAADESRSVTFEYVSGAGTASATFSAASVSPLSGVAGYNIYLTSNLPGGYGNQTQAGNGSTAHLGYAATISGVDTYEGPSFNQAWAQDHGGTFACSSVLRIRAQLPTHDIANAVQKVTIKSSSAIFAEDNEIGVTISTPGAEGDSKVVTVYATLPTGNVSIPSGTEFVFQFQVSDDVNDKYTAYRKTDSPFALNEGVVNSFKINCPGITSYAGIGDAGTEAAPYLIGDRHQMQAMHDLLGEGETKYFRLVDDVDLSAITPWQPLCLAVAEGKKLYFDGAGHAVSHLTAGDTYNYPSFAGYLCGEVKNVIFDQAVISCGSTKEQSAGVVAAYLGGSGNLANCSGVTITNSTLTSGGAFLGGLAARVGKSASVQNCHVVNTTLSTSGSGSNVAGLLAYIDSNNDLSITDCSADRITVTGANGYYAAGLVGQIASSHAVSIRRCHTTGSVNRSGSGRHFGGLVGSVQSANVSIVNCYSTCSVTGYQFAGGLVGSWWSTSSFTGGSGSIDHCFASGTVSDKGNSGDGGLVGSLEVPGVSITNSIAWNDAVTANKYGDANYSSGAIVGRTHPNSRLENNYRKPGMSITAYWVPGSDFDHPDSKKVDDTYYIWKIGSDLIEANGAYTTATAISSPIGLWAYHGKHLEAGAVVEPSNTLGWVSDDIPGSGSEDPENPSYTGANVWVGQASGATQTIRPGVEWTTFHGQWEGEWRTINIIRTTLSEGNHLGVFHDYKTEDRLYLNEKCDYVGAVAGTNGSMACCHFVRVNDEIKHAATNQNEWTANCALTIDGDDVNIVKVADNFDAATLPNQTVSCAGPLLVWKGYKLTASDEWLAADSESWLTDTHPRTAIGITKDGNTVIQVTVDGRWIGNSDGTRRATGMSTDLLAQLMLELGCYKAMNLDGGGGTQMWIGGYGDSNGIVNHPHNEWPYYGCGSGKYYYDKTPAARRTCGSAIYIKSN